MAKETTSKKLNLISSYDLKDPSIHDLSKKRRSFVMRYWFDEVTYLNETKERFKYLPRDSSLKLECEQILKSHGLDGSNIRFEEGLVYVLLVSKGSS